LIRRRTGIYGAQVTKTRLQRHLQWWRARDLQLLAGLAAIGGLLLVFIKIGRAVSVEGTDQIDQAILLLFRNTPSDPIGSEQMQAAVMHISALGSGMVTGLIVLIVTLFCAVAGHWRYAALTVACSIGTGLAMWVLKDFYERDRPSIVTHIDPPGGHSFPSGHSMISAALYMTLAVLISRTLERRRLRVFVIAAGAFIALLIGVSRMYLGVHYPTDVLAGWTAGLLWALVCGLVVRMLGKRGNVPTPHAEGDTLAGGDTSLESDQHQ
jgi:undecaprenyl-diphosphatase